MLSVLLRPFAWRASHAALLCCVHALPCPAPPAAGHWCRL